MTERTTRRSWLWIPAVIGVWLVLWAVLLFSVYSYGRENYVFCWDSVQVDEDLLIALCNMTEDEYLAGASLSDCPEGYDAIRMVGACEPEWDMIRSKMISTSIIFNAIFWIIVGATALLRRRARRVARGAP